MPQNPHLRKIAHMDVRPALRAHLVTAWLVFGGYMLYCLCFLPLEHLIHLLTVKSLFYIALLFLFLPVLAFGGGGGIAVSLVEQHSYHTLFMGSAALAVYVLLWHIVWRAMYGRRGLFAHPTP